VLVEARLLDQGTWGKVAATRGGATDSVNFDTITQAGSYEFRITYTDAAGLVTALGAGVVTFGAAGVTRVQPSYEITTPPYVPGNPGSAAQYTHQSTTASTPSAISDPRLSFAATHTGGTAPGDHVLRPKIEQKLDRWGNVIETTDPRNAQWKTTYKWNWANQLVEQMRPADESNGGARPITRLYYDALGRQVGIRDARGNVNTQVFDQAGNLIEQGQADGGRVTHFYNALGAADRSGRDGRAGAAAQGRKDDGFQVRQDGPAGREQARPGERVQHAARPGHARADGERAGVAQPHRDLHV
jgi:YD repeat-containing protein